MEQLLRAVSSSLNNAATTIGHCVHWVLSRGHAQPQLTEDELRRLSEVRALLRDKFDRSNPEHRVRLGMPALPVSMRFHSRLLTAPSRRSWMHSKVAVLLHKV